jgi:serine phosphatase RsbU (regulator of sigma subunit)
MRKKEFELKTICPVGKCPVTIQGNPHEGEFRIVKCSRLAEGESCQQQCHGQVQFEHSLELARRVQEMLQPEPLQRFEGLTVATWMSVSQRVGGDFQAVHGLRDRLLAIQGDVMGKGAAAALLAAYLVGIFDSLAERGTPALEILSVMNQRVAQRTEGRPMFATAMLVEARFKARSWAFYRAGHEWPFLLRQSHRDWTLDFEPSLPLGVDRHEVYSWSHSRLLQGDQVLLVTDGGREVGLNDAGIRELMAQESTTLLPKRIADSIAYPPPYRDDVSLLWLGVDKQV